MAFKVLCLLLSGSAVLALPACSSLEEMGTLMQPAPEVAVRETATTSGGQDQALQKALASSGDAFEKDPANPENALTHSKNLMSAGRNEEALSVLQTGMKHNPDHQKLASDYGRLALKLNKDSAAEQALKKAEANGAKDWRFFSAQGTVLAKQGHHEKAQAHFRQALDLAPDEPSVINNLALSYALNGKPAEGERLLRKVIDTGKANDKMKQNMALILSLQGRFEEAKTLIKNSMPPEQAEQEIQELRKFVQTPIASEPKPVVQKANLITEDPQKQITKEKKKVDAKPVKVKTNQKTVADELRGPQQGDPVDLDTSFETDPKAPKQPQSGPRTLKAPAQKDLKSELSKGWIAQIENPQK